MGEKQRDQNLIWSKLIQFNLITKFSGMRKYLLDFKAYATVLMVNIQEKKTFNAAYTIDWITYCLNFRTIRIYRLSQVTRFNIPFFYKLFTSTNFLVKKYRQYEQVTLITWKWTWTSKLIIYTNIYYVTRSLVSYSNLPKSWPWPIPNISGTSLLWNK